MEKENERICSPRVIKTYLEKTTGPKFEELGVTPSGAPFLGEIAYNEGISLKGLTEILMVDKAHTTRTVSKLIEAGLVEDRAEGREYSLYLTEEGKAVVDKIKVIMDDAWKGLLKDLTPEEMDTLMVILQKISNTVKEA
ncbi:MAG: MarR family transcriptional regulator [Thermoplasmata archaeon]|nr:MarR family transcriptional regulator [Thermoplasmata archaeon]